jgi:hypothetical protein
LNLGAVERCQNRVEVDGLVEACQSARVFDVIERPGVDGFDLRSLLGLVTPFEESLVEGSPKSLMPRPIGSPGLINEGDGLIGLLEVRPSERGGCLAVEPIPQLDPSPKRLRFTLASGDVVDPDPADAVVLPDAALAR